MAIGHKILTGIYVSKAAKQTYTFFLYASFLIYKTCLAMTAIGKVQCRIRTGKIWEVKPSSKNTGHRAEREKRKGKELEARYGDGWTKKKNVWVEELDTLRRFQSQLFLLPSWVDILSSSTLSSYSHIISYLRCIPDSALFAAEHNAVFQCALMHSYALMYSYTRAILIKKKKDSDVQSWNCEDIWSENYRSSEMRRSKSFPRRWQGERGGSA